MKIYDSSTTIVALSSPTGGALCVVRLSGHRALEIVRAQTGGREFRPRVATFAEFLGGGGEVIDQCVVTYFRGPGSFTGQDTVEICAHGSPWIAAQILDGCIAHGAVAAGPGEFSQRAFLSGKMDLCQIEAIADLIQSESAGAARVAMNQLRGGYSRDFSELRSSLLKVLSLLELELDFGEEEVEFASRSELVEITQEILEKVRQLTDSFRLGNALKNGVGVAIVGAPNAGKSTLLNALLREERAIVSAEAGTTRDFIEASTVIDGILFRFIDTAGIREGLSAVEIAGIERSHQQMQRADVVLHLIAPDSTETPVNISTQEGQSLITIYTKADISENSATPETIAISAKNGDGIEELKARLRAMVGSDRSEQTVVSNARHHAALLACAPFFERAIEGLQSELPAELISSELRGGLQFLDEITGEITSDQILHSIFSNHCIGK